MTDEKLLSTLMKLIQDRDHKAFESFYDLTVDGLTIFIKTQTNLEVEDLLSQIYINIWEKSHLFNPQKGSVKSWMYTIARNHVITEHRKSKETSDIHEFEEVLEGDDDPKGKANLSLESEKLYTAIGKLKDDFKNVVLFRFLEGYSVNETAEIMGISEANVRTIQHRALKELGNILGK